MAGLPHQVTGLDHLLAMLAVGIVSVRLDSANIWRIPATFLLAMAWALGPALHGRCCCWG